ncbi:MAG: class I SAM-dependent methyltransferase [Gammaproteobacteria bacterium]|nr:class I SAM-dependent methyltransferase [Gammaproteobacteria bacterium]
MSQASSNHWDEIFSNTEETNLGWYEDDVSLTLKLLKPIPNWEHSNMFMVGTGISRLIETVLAKSVRLSLNDISPKALEKVKSRLGKESGSVNWLCQDISKPINDSDQRPASVDIWIDRAVLHFLNDEQSICGYFENLNKVLKKGGHSLFAEFSKKGAATCADLELHRYSVDELTERLGSTYQLIDSFEHIYMNPKGEPRPYVYCLYQKLS